MRYCSSCILFLAHDFMQPCLRSSLAVAYKALKTTMIISTLYCPILQLKYTTFPYIVYY